MPFIYPQLSFRHARPYQKRAGFALLITITLLAFLVLLLVSLASLTRVETQVASNNQQTTQARQNALMALNIAVGELQKYAGRDQRTTARADIDSSLINDNTKNGRWVGVYGSRVAADYSDDPGTIASKIANAYSAASGSDATTQSGSLPRKGSQAILLTWLVSGNESTAGFSPSSHVASDGHIILTETATAASAAFNKPSDPTLASANVTPSASDNHALLVGPASVSISSLVPPPAVSDYVSAPLVNIQIPESSLPGFGSSGTAQRTIGRYAWWVGDEGTKAHINLAPEPSIAPLPPANPGLAFTTFQRNAIELVDKTNSIGFSGAFNSADLVGAAYNPTQTNINRLLTPQQLPSLNTSTWSNARKLRFHDLTASSYSLLTDTYAGGLKKDLSALLAIGASAPADNETLFVPTAGDLPYGLPTWGKLRSYVQNRELSSGASYYNPDGTLAPSLPSPTNVGLSPVMPYADIRFQYFVEGGVVKLAIMPRIVLWNPHTRQIGSPTSPARFEFGISTGFGYFQLRRRLLSAGDSAPWTTIEGPRAVRWACEGAPPSGTDRVHYLRFVVESQGISPGESHMFGLTQVEAYNAPNGSAPTNIMSWTDDPRYAVITTSVLDNDAPPGDSWVYRVKADENATGTNEQRRGYYGAGSQSGLHAYLGLNPAQHTTYSPQDIWPPTAAVTNPWYQATYRQGVSGGGAETPAGNASAAYLQNDSTAGITLYSEPADADWWGHVITYTFSTNIRYLMVSNPRGAYRNNPSTTLCQGTNLPGLGENAAIGSPSVHMLSKAGKGYLSSTRSLDVPVSQTSAENSILYESRAPDQPFMSIGQLQHANLSFAMAWPGYLVGNSNAPTLKLSADTVNRPALYADPNVRYDNTDSYMPRPAGENYNAAYLVNRMLWDRYFVSTIPNDGTGASGVTAMPDILPNPRHVWQTSAATLSDAQKRDGTTVAAHLVLKGGFNINSTSEQAWRAILGGGNQLNQHTSGSVLDSPADSAISRFTNPPAGVTRTGSRTDWAFTGYRTLTSAQIDALAKAIVEQIRNRGPFISMGDFINRRLKDNPDTTEPSSAPKFNHIESVKGTLQEAIDHTPEAGVSSLNNRLSYTPLNSAGGTAVTHGQDYEAMWGGAAGNLTLGSSSRAYGVPQSVTQADILSAIGPSLSARSDTFTVRTYGDVSNPVTGEITARAWCEAVVQRTIDPVTRKSSDPASPDYYEPTAGTAANPNLGRRFKIISFRWLSPSDI